MTLYGRNMTRTLRLDWWSAPSTAPVGADVRVPASSSRYVPVCSPSLANGAPTVFEWPVCLTAAG